MGTKRQPISKRRRKPKRGRPKKPPAPVIAKGLSAKERRLVEEYCVDLNATQAAIRAGYSKRSARTLGPRTLLKDDIQQAVVQFRAELAQRTQVTAAEIANELRKLGFSNVADFHRVSEDGDPIIDLSECSREQLAALTEIEVHDYTDGRGEDARDVRKVRIKLADKRQALVDLAKLLGYMKDKVEHSGDLTVKDEREVIKAELQTLTTEELRQVVAHYDAIRRIKAGEPLLIGSGSTPAATVAQNGAPA